MKTKNITLIGIETALICIFAPISIPLPFSPVPITFSTLFIYICAISTSSKIATSSVILYLLLGLMGMPVFSNYSCGIGCLLGPTGGYFLGYIFCAFLTGIASDFFPNNKIIIFFSMLISTLFCYFFGTLWLSKTLNSPFINALSVGVFPYIIGDILKIIFALVIGTKIRQTQKWL